MPIQTSQITTETNGNLSISPNGTGETLISSVDVARADAGTTEDTPVSVAPDGTVKKVDLSTLPVINKDDLASTDLIAVQKADGDFYKIDADSLSGPSVIDPGVNATLTISPTPGTGDGTAGNPYVLTSVTVGTPGETVQTVETFSISGAPANGILYVTFTDNQGGRFLDKVLIADASGNIAAFSLTFVDEPESTTGTTYTGKVRFGQASIYAQWGSTVQVSNTDFVGGDGTTSAPNGSPASANGGGIFGTGSASWADGAKTLQSDPNVQFQVNGGGYGNGPTSVSDGDTVDVIFLQSAVDGAADGATISGDLTSTDGSFSKTFSMVKDISPSLTFGSLSSVATSSTQQSGSVTATGYNATLAVTAGTAGTDEMTNILVSIDGGAFSALPQNMFPGQTLEVQGDVGSASNTTYTANVNVGSTAVTFSATTTAVTPTIQQPTITSPVDGSADLTPDVSVVSDAYVGNNSPGPHTSSDWEVYEADTGVLEAGGIITGVSADGLTLTMSNTTNLDKLANGTAVQMDTTYTPVSSTITNVEAVNQPQSFTGTEGDGDVGKAFDGLGNEGEIASISNSVYTLTNDLVLTLNLPYTSKVEIVGVSAYGASGPSVARGYGINGGSEQFLNTQASSGATLTKVEVLTGAGTLNTIKVFGTAAGNLLLSQVWIDGVLIVNGSTTLTTTDATDLAYMEVGDTVQSDNDWNQSQEWSSTAVTSYTDAFNLTTFPPSRVFDGTTTAEMAFNTNAEVDFLTNVNVTSSAEILTYCSGGTVSSVTINGNAATAGASENAGVWYSVSMTGALTNISVSGTNNIYFIAIKVDGNLLVDASVNDSTAVSIIGIDTSLPGIAVDGGSWTGSDGTSSGTAADRETVVTSQSKQGTGTFVSNFGTAVTLSGVGSKWVANDNGGEGTGTAIDFYLTDPAQTGGPGAPTTEPPSADYTQVVNSAGDTSNLTSYTLTSSELRTDKAYYSRVKYNDDGSTGSTISSDFSNYNEFTVGSIPPTDWVQSPAGAAEANQWRSVTYGNNTYVAVSETGTNRVMYSTDGISWTSASATEANQWNSVTYGNGKFVAVSTTGTNRVMYSTDGISWSSAAATQANGWTSVTYDNGKFVAVALSGTSRVMYSADGISWTAASAAEANLWRSVTYGNGMFVAVSTSGTNRVMYSADGISWTAASATEANKWNSVTYGNGKFVAVAESGTNRVMYSTDGINWTSASAPEANQWRSVTYGNGYFVAVSQDGSIGQVMYSEDATSWTSAKEAVFATWSSVTYGVGKFVAIADAGGSVMYSFA